MVNAVRDVPALPWSLYPNPATDVMTIRFPRDTGVTEVRLLDHMGRLLVRKVCMHGEEETDISVGEMPSGVYNQQLCMDHSFLSRRVVKK